MKLNVTDNLKDHYLPEGRDDYHLLGKLNLLDAVNFSGIVKQGDLKGYYEKADIFIFSSLIESFGQGLLEAMSNGLPCVVTDIPIFKEIGKDSVLYFKAGDSADLRDKLELLLKNYELRFELGRKAKIRAKDFSWENHVHKIEEIISTL